MSHFDEILELSLDNYGLVSFAQARELGIAGSELNRFVEAGRLSKVGRGLYQVTARIPTSYDRFAQAAALVGEGSVLYGTAVLSMMDLANVNPREVEVATNRRVRKELPEWVHMRSGDNVGEVTKYQGIPSQTVYYAIMSSSDMVMSDRLLDAAEKAYERGLISGDELDSIRDELGDDEG